MRYEKILHSVVWRAMILPLCAWLYLSGCSGSEEDEASVPMPTQMELNIALAAGAEDGKYIEFEAVKKDGLRIILINANDTEDKWTVEYNNVPLQKDIEGPLSVGDSRYVHVYKVKLRNITPGKKRIYALGNVEGVSGMEEIKAVNKGESATELIARLEALELSGAIANLSDGYVPMSSPAYCADVQYDETTGMMAGEVPEIVMAYAAVKFSFKFVNAIEKVEDRQDLTIVGWTFRPLATKSYLLPHMLPDSWQQLINLGGTTSESASEWVTDYDIPTMTDVEGQIDYVYTYETPFTLGYKERKDEEEDDIFYYLHESKSKLKDERDASQAYYLTLRIREENTPKDKFLICGPKQLLNLKSLVRGTHVRIIATIKALPDAGDNSFEVRVKTWGQGNSSIGGWEEVTDNEETDEQK